MITDSDTCGAIRQGDEELHGEANSWRKPLGKGTGIQPGGIWSNEWRVAARPLKRSNLLIGGNVNVREVLLWCRRTVVFRRTIDDACRDLGNLRRAESLARHPLL